MEPRSPDGAGGSRSVGRPAEAAHQDSARGPQAPEDTAHSRLPLPHPAALLRSTALARRAALSSSRVGCHSSRARPHCAVREEWRSREPAQVHPVKAPCTDPEAPRGETRSTPALLFGAQTELLSTFSKVCFPSPVDTPYLAATSVKPVIPYVAP